MRHIFLAQTTGGIKPELLAALQSADLLEYIAAHRRPKGRHSLFIDELQEIDGFQMSLRSLQAEGNVEIFGTGSNAKLLSGSW